MRPGPSRGPGPEAWPGPALGSAPEPEPEPGSEPERETEPEPKPGSESESQPEPEPGAVQSARRITSSTGLMRHTLAPQIGTVLVPPHNYGMVEEGLYRCSQPNELNLALLEKLGLKTVIYLAAEEPTDFFHSFIDDHAINLVHLGWEASGTQSQWKPMSEETVLAALDIILDKAHYPILMMCAQGSHRTGIVVGCLRKLQRWNLVSIFEEYRRYGGSKTLSHNEQFIELFDTDLVSTQKGATVAWMLALEEWWGAPVDASSATFPAVAGVRGGSTGGTTSSSGKGSAAKPTYLSSKELAATVAVGGQDAAHS